MLFRTMWSVKLLLACIGAHGTNFSLLSTNPNKTNNYPCGDTGDGRSESVRWDYAVRVQRASSTTFNVHFDDDKLQKRRNYHPLKCHDEYYGYGVLRILFMPCQLESDDIEMCYRSSNFAYPTPPSSKNLKIDLFVNENGTGFYDPEGTTKFKWSRTPEAGNISLEFCGMVETCVPNSGTCVQAFTVLALDAESYYEQLLPINQWPGYSILPLDAWAHLDGWNQPSAIPAYGPYPPCPEDDLGQAELCSGNETLTINLRSVNIIRAEISDDGSVSFAISYSLEWGDRFAVHPCTVNLFSIFTAGQPYTLPSEKFWSPSLSLANEAKAAKTLQTDRAVGVNYGFGEPVTANAEAGSAWPKQLVLSRHFSVEYYPAVALDWTKYPFDSQDMQITLEQKSIGAGRLKLRTDDLEFGHGKADVGAGWTKQSASIQVVQRDGNDAIQVAVRVARNPTGKIYTLILPILSVAVFEIAFHLLAEYSNTHGVFTTQALIMGLGISLTDPSRLGFPNTVKVMPLAQCFALMIVIGGFKTALLVLGRVRYERLIIKTKRAITVLLDTSGEGWKFGLEFPDTRKVMEHHAAMPGRQVPWGPLEPNSEKPGETEYVKYLNLVRDRVDLTRRLRQYDKVIRLTVPVWYFLAWLSVSVA
eukprot:TRINITY_DN92789_c0_g1_i1.p1 TRINITY_DN92789_c0_g1~~TRINITY_DN92789_c0_g1_i1.p1  ORF type:complete len:645 (-),score=60.97 TRINITY_DN92789_c0_g1_i1:15-1949(-)